MPVPPKASHTGRDPEVTNLLLFAELLGFSFERGDFFFDASDFARLVFLLFHAGQFLTEHQELLLDHFEPFLGFAVHRWCSSCGLAGE